MQRVRPVARACYMRNGPREGACTLFFCMYCIAGLCAHMLPIYNLRTEIMSTPYIGYWDQSICLILFFIVAFRLTGIVSRHLEPSDVFSPPKASESFWCLEELQIWKDHRPPLIPTQTPQRHTPPRTTGRRSQRQPRVARQLVSPQPEVRATGVRAPIDVDTKRGWA